MKENESDREWLMKQAKLMSCKTDSIPAIHPRYHNIYRNLYNDTEKREHPFQGLIVRMLLAVLCFISLSVNEKNNLDMCAVHTQDIVSYIEKQTDFSNIRELDLQNIFILDDKKEK